jgi:hypothetical protein
LADVAGLVDAGGEIAAAGGWGNGLAGAVGLAGAGGEIAAAGGWGNGLPGADGVADAGNGFCVLTSLAFGTTEGGSAGATVIGPATCDALGDGLGSDETTWPLRLVIVTTLVVVFTTTVLWMLLKMTGFGGGATYVGALT